MAEGENRQNGDAPGPPSDLELRIIEQVEYYFGDTNLRKDKFMKECIAEDEGWVSMDTMLKFRRLQQLSDDKAVICCALKKSKSGLMEVADDNSKIRRSPEKPVAEMTEDARHDLNKRTGYAKGFPRTANLDDIKAFLSRHGFTSDHVRGIVMRRLPDTRAFKGSVFIEFATTADVERFVSPDVEMKFAEDEEPVLRLTREAYYQKENEERRQHKLEAKAQAAASAASAKSEEADLPFVEGCVLNFDGCGEETTREMLKEKFGRFEDVAWVTFKIKDTAGQIRFVNSGGAARALEKVREEGDGKVMIDDVEATCRVLEGEEEKKYWQQMREEKAQMKARNRAVHSNRQGGRGGRGGGGGRGRGRGFRGKRRGDSGEGAPRAKRARE